MAMSKKDMGRKSAKKNLNNWLLPEAVMLRKNLQRPRKR